MNIWSRLAGGINLQDGSKGSHILAFISCGLFPRWTGMTFVTNKIIPQQWQTITSKVRTSKKCWHVLLLHLWVDSTTLEKFLPTNTNLLDIGVSYLGNVSQPSDFFKWLWSLLAQEVVPPWGFVKSIQTKRCTNCGFLTLDFLPSKNHEPNKS